MMEKFDHGTHHAGVPSARIDRRDGTGTNAALVLAGRCATHDPHAQNEGVNNQINGQIYEQLLTRDKNLKSIPCLAISWKQASPTVWVFNLRRGVSGRTVPPSLPTSVVFSILRAQQDTSNMKVYAVALGKPRKIDDFTVELTTPVPNPVLIDMVSSGNIFIMSKAWSDQASGGKAAGLQDPARKPGRRATPMGTGPYMLVSREPDVKTVLKKNPNWWGIAEGRFEGNVDEVVYRPIKQASTRIAALLSGEIDFRSRSAGAGCAES